MRQILAIGLFLTGISISQASEDLTLKSLQLGQAFFEDGRRVPGLGFRCSSFGYGWELGTKQKVIDIGGTWKTRSRKTPPKIHSLEIQFRTGRIEVVPPDQVTHRNGKYSFRFLEPEWFAEKRLYAWVNIFLSGSYLGKKVRILVSAMQRIEH